MARLDLPVLANEQNPEPKKYSWNTVKNHSEYEELDLIKYGIKDDVSHSALPYRDILLQNGINKPINRYLNNNGWYRGDLKEFHKVYFSSTTLSMLLTNKVDMVVQDNITINKKELKDTKSIKQIQEYLSVYGTCLGYITTKAKSFLDSEIDIIEPYRYGQANDGYHIYTLTDKVHVDNKATYPVYNDIWIFPEVNADTHEVTYTVQSLYKYFDGEQTMISHQHAGTITNNLNYNPVYEFKGDKCDLDNIKLNLALIDMTTTMQALEIKTTPYTVHADEKYFKMGEMVKKSFYRIHSDPNNPDSKPLFESNQPNLRSDIYSNLINDYRIDIANELGASPRALGFNTAQILATVALIDEEQTVKTINGVKKDLKYILQDMLDTIFSGDVIDIPKYVSENVQQVAVIVKELGFNASVYEKVKMLHPTYDNDMILKEVCTIKIENNILMTEIESEFASKNKLLPTEEIDSNNFGG